MTGWERVRDELDIWAAEKRVAQFWWRDDDAQDVSPRLKRMLSIAQNFDVSVALSVIPVGTKAGLVKYLQASNQAQVLVHGYAHKNYARKGQAKRELGGARALNDIIEDLANGLALARASFGERVLPVMVPPWNRIAPKAVEVLPRLGYRGISTWKPRLKVTACAGLTQVNAHLDVIDWRRGRRVKSEAQIAGLLLRKLRWRRADPERASEPLGLLTHHQLWSAEKENTIVQFLGITREHRAVIWRPATAVFGL